MLHRLAHDMAMQTGTRVLADIVQQLEGHGMTIEEVDLQAQENNHVEASMTLDLSDVVPDS
jgi:(p)ppGpp synthase/HD superfamily hydrolase